MPSHHAYHAAAATALRNAAVALTPSLHCGRRFCWLVSLSYITLCPPLSTPLSCVWVWVCDYAHFAPPWASKGGCGVVRREGQGGKERKQNKRGATLSGSFTANQTKREKREASLLHDCQAANRKSALCIILPHHAAAHLLFSLSIFFSFSFPFFVVSCVACFPDCYPAIRRLCSDSLRVFIFSILYACTVFLSVCCCCNCPLLVLHSPPSTSPPHSLPHIHTHRLFLFLCVCVCMCPPTF